ncbi:hypothetical protein DMC30DRAFT_432530, partial [Rhodotorula diobovata]
DQGAPEARLAGSQDRLRRGQGPPCRRVAAHARRARVRRCGARGPCRNTARRRLAGRADDALHPGPHRRQRRHRRGRQARDRAKQPRRLIQGRAVQRLDSGTDLRPRRLGSARAARPIRVADGVARRALAHALVQPRAAQDAPRLPPVRAEPRAGGGCRRACPLRRGPVAPRAVDQGGHRNGRPALRTRAGDIHLGPRVRARRPVPLVCRCEPSPRDLFGLHRSV